MTFVCDITSTKFFSSKADGVTSYETWCNAAGINSQDFPFTVKTGRKYSGTAVTFNITSWGCYENADREWVIFIAYYAAKPKHTSQYSWVVGADGKIQGTPRLYEFIN